MSERLRSDKPEGSFQKGVAFVKRGERERERGGGDPFCMVHLTFNLGDKAFHAQESIFIPYLKLSCAFFSN